MDINAIKKIVGKIKTNLFKNANSFSIGMLKSHFVGVGLQFKEHQLYTHGDDVRFIDWKILAKTQVPFIKTFDEERNVEIAVIIDASPTMLTGHNNISKLQAAINLTCLLYILAAETNDFVHVTIISDKVIYLPLKNGDHGIAQLVAALLKNGIIDSEGDVLLTPKRSAAIMEDKVNSLMKHFYRRREIVIFSDFNDFLDDSVLRRIFRKAHVHCFRIISPLDEAKSSAYAIYTKREQYSDKGEFSKLYLGDDKNIKHMLSKHFKELKVHDRYLESFVKEML